MKIIRTICSILFGAILAVVIIIAAEAINSAYHLPHGTSFEEFQKTMQTDKQAMKTWVESLPESAMVAVLLGWEFGAFLGGALAALIAGCCRLVHAAVVGVLVLAATVMIFYRLKVEYDISHPDYMILIGLLLPIPCALLGGKLVSLIFQSNHSASRAA